MMHVTESSGPFACKGAGVKRKFILPNEYKQFLHVDEVDEEEEDDSNFLDAIDNESKSNIGNSGDEWD